MQDNNLSLDLLEIGKKALVVKINSSGDIKRRLLDIGLVENTFVECVLYSPFKDPKAYLIKGATIAIRNDDAKNIIVRCLENE